MALTKVGKEGITGISNSSDATAITIDSSENVTFAAATRAPNSSASAPAYAFSNDTSSGMFLPGADTLAFSSGGSERMRINSSGSLLIGATSFSSGGGGIKFGGVGNRDLSVNGTGAIQQLGFHNPNGEVGSIFTSANSTSFATASDYRIKENVADMTGAIARVKALAPKRFNFIADADTTVDGFLAHEAQAVVPEAVHGTHNEVDDNGNAVMQGIDQSKLVPLLTGALQEAITKIETLETEMTALKARVTALEDA
jgi:hypothetical protein|tara:strand:- start:419 stop:1186 length:768 start_codon:yes stop_codon:yes gene_type:complete